MSLPIDSKLTFYIRHNKSIHAEFPSNYTIWLRRGKRWQNRGDALTNEAARIKADEIARRGHRDYEFVDAGF